MSGEYFDKHKVIIIPVQKKSQNHRSLLSRSLDDIIRWSFTSCIGPCTYRLFLFRFTFDNNKIRSQIVLYRFSIFVQLFKAFRITGSSGSVDGILKKILNSLCILLIWLEFFKYQHFCSLWPICQSYMLGNGREQVFLLPHVKYVTFTVLVKQLHVRNMRPLSWYYAGILRLSWC